MDGTLTLSMQRFDKIAEVCRYYYQMVFPDLVERDDKVLIVFPDGHSYLVGLPGEPENRIAHRINTFLDKTEEALRDDRNRN